MEDLPDEERGRARGGASGEGADAASEALDELPELARHVLRERLHPGRGVHVDPRGGRRPVGHRRRVPDAPGPEEHVFDPISFLEDDEPTDVEPAERGRRGDRRHGRGLRGGRAGSSCWPSGSIPSAALAAVDGWGGDAYRGYTDERPHVRRAAVRRRDRGAPPRHGGGPGRLGGGDAGRGGRGGGAPRRRGRPGDLRSGADADVLEGDGRSRDDDLAPGDAVGAGDRGPSSGGTDDQARCFSSGLIASLDYELLVTRRADGRPAGADRDGPHRASRPLPVTTLREVTRAPRRAPGRTRRRRGSHCERVDGQGLDGGADSRALPGCRRLSSWARARTGAATSRCPRPP